MSQNKINKKELQKKKEQIDERFAAYRRGLREDEIDEHNGKPFTHPQITTNKKKYNRKIMKRLERDDY